MELPKEIFPVNYAGFYDFSEDGKYGDSVINIEDYANAEQIAKAISMRYNNHDKLVEQLKQDHETILRLYQSVSNGCDDEKWMKEIRQTMTNIQTILKHLESNPLTTN